VLQPLAVRECSDNARPGTNSAGIEELVDEHGVTPKFELTSARLHAIYQDLYKEPVERRAEFWLPLAGHRSYQSMRKLSPDHRSDLCHLLGRSEPVKPRHQRRNRTTTILSRPKSSRSILQ
jgi:hypothetical protein